ncbi:hypothetical protein M231_03643 [Tremella mesenterica]|uniref:Integrase zinc-binding domain-containing protein n=1 Tax=Tremella mesenterica TaxID=5217 RepID=A0A4Q1BMS4_TREME|nr:hypothetical protein M231_03643 [Tremella mesenterica]
MPVDQATQRHTSFPTSPTVASTVFPYSLRADTTYSAGWGRVPASQLVDSPSVYDQTARENISYYSGQGVDPYYTQGRTDLSYYSQNGNAHPHHSRGLNQHQSPTHLTRNSYHGTNLNDSHQVDPGTAWSRSSWNGPRTDAIPEEHAEAYGYGTAGLIPSSAYPSSEKGMVPFPIKGQHQNATYMNTPFIQGSAIPSSAPARSTRFSLPRPVRRTTIAFPPLTEIPLDQQGQYQQYQQYQQNQTFQDVRNSQFTQDPFADPLPPNKENEVQWRKSYVAQLTPGANMMTPHQQQRLGRMSVAAPRYSLPPNRPNSGSVGNKSFGKVLKRNATVTRWRKSKIGRMYLTWREFIIAGSSLICALLLTMGLQVSSMSVGKVVSVPGGAFVKAQGDGTEVALGFYGWCQVGVPNPICEAYSQGDFVNADSSFQIWGDSTLDNLASMTTALASFTWLLAIYHLVTAFLHFYLFFALSIPFSHLIDTTDPIPSSTDEKQGEKFDDPLPVDPIQAEVDVRARFERLPFEGYLWVWWAWFGHRRSPIGHVYSTLVGILSLASLGFAVEFKKGIVSATSNTNITLGPGAYLPLITLLFTLDPLICAIRYWSTASLSIHNFLHPPEPVPTALFPPWEKMQHVRTSSASMFLPPETAPPLPVPLPVVEEELDPETKRWLDAYPSDPELVPLIESLREGQENDDFILSDVGLLYLRPSDPDSDEPALLVPPAGVRTELLEDVHLAPDEEGQSAHHLADEMLKILSETFWWVGMEEDVRAYIGKCGYCALREDKEQEKDWMEGRSPPALKPGMTPVEFTGVDWTANDTGVVADRWGVGESAMAADMAVAMRKAQEDGS